MSLVVVGTEASPSTLVANLQALGSQPSRVAEEQDAIARCESGTADILLTYHAEFAKRIAAEFPSVAVIHAVHDKPSAESMLALVREGVADVWFDDQGEQVTAERLAAVTRRAKAAGQELRARINQYESELKRDQRAGRYIQMGMLPPSPMMIDDYRLQQDMLPSHMLSGDFVDYFAFADGYFAAYVADVSGHGASSAFVTVLLKNFSRRIRREYHPKMLNEPGQILEWLNREILEQHIDKHVAMVLVVADCKRHQFTIVNAGHYPAAILVSNGQARFVENAGKPVGLFPKVSFESYTADIGEEDRLVVFSDGVLEMLDEPTHTEREQKLLDVAASAEDVREVWRAFGFDEERSGPDDMTCLIVSREP